MSARPRFRPSSALRVAPFCALALGMAVHGAVLAQTAPQSHESDMVAPAVPNDAALRDFIGAHVDLQDVRVQVDVGNLDPRLRLKPCDRVEPFVPTGARLYGRTHLGLRCKQPGGWTVYLPINVRVFAPVPVAKRNLVNGETLHDADVAFEEREISSPGSGPFPAKEQIDGRVLARGFMAGQAIASTAFRPNPVIANGDPVKVIVHGNGFAITTPGVALSQADEGQPLRVKLESGKTVQGIARTGKQVELAI